MDYIAYYRVSTTRQGQSGLGLEAQQEVVVQYLHAHGGRVLATFVEIESGRREDRPKLTAALQDCRLRRAALLVAKLDRLARSARFLSEVLDAGVDVVFCDLPAVPAGAVGRFLLQQMAAVAELEAGLISERTRAALTAAKTRGTKLGGRPENFGDRRGAGSRAGAAAGRTQAAARAADLAGVFAEIRAAGIRTQSARHPCRAWWIVAGRAGPARAGAPPRRCLALR